MSSAKSNSIPVRLLTSRSFNSTARKKLNNIVEHVLQQALPACRTILRTEGEFVDYAARCFPPDWVHQARRRL